jgi:hypothetical protein
LQDYCDRVVLLTTDAKITTFVEGE